MREAMAVMRYAVESMLHRVMILVVIWGIVGLIDLVIIKEVIVVRLWFAIIV